MAYQSTFKRYEIKYLLTNEQKACLTEAMSPYMALDKYGRTTIRNIYFDTENYRLIRSSIEKPIYKEKLRLRSYRQVSKEEPVFVELKKKYDHVVYKRRIAMPEHKALKWLQGQSDDGPTCQIGQEIGYFLSFYETLQPKVFLCYDREAWFSKDGSDFRVTFDDTILYRETGLFLHEEPGGIPLLPEGQVLMEVKTSGALPLWMTHVLTENHIFKTSFSKYGAAYQHLILQGGKLHV